MSVGTSTPAREVSITEEWKRKERRRGRRRLGLVAVVAADRRARGGSERRDGRRSGGLAWRAAASEGASAQGPGFWRGAQRQARARARKVRATCGDGDRVPGEGSNAQGSGAAAHKGATQGERCDGDRERQVAEHSSRRGRARAGSGMACGGARTVPMCARQMHRRRAVEKVAELTHAHSRRQMNPAARALRGGRRP